MTYQIYQTMSGETMVMKPGFNGGITHFPMHPDNTDYQQFVRDIKNGVQLNDAEGNQMTPEQITTFLETLP